MEKKYPFTLTSLPFTGSGNKHGIPLQKLIILIDTTIVAFTA